MELTYLQARNKISDLINTLEKKELEYYENIAYERKNTDEESTIQGIISMDVPKTHLDIRIEIELKNGEFDCCLATTDNDNIGEIVHIFYDYEDTMEYLNNLSNKVANWIEEEE